MHDDKRVSLSRRHCNPKCVGPKNRAGKCVKQKRKELKGEIDKCTITVGDFSTQLSPADRTTRQKTIPARPAGIETSVVLSINGSRHL